MPKRTRSSNLGLPPLPDDVTVLAALATMCEEPRWHRHGGALASFLAGRLGIQGANRLGRGAVKGSWSGSMDAGLRLVPRLRSLTKRGLVCQGYDFSDRGRAVYNITPAGLAYLEQHGA